MTLSYQDAQVKKMSLKVLGYEDILPSKLKAEQDEQIRKWSLNILGEEKKKLVEWKPKIYEPKKLITLQDLKNAPDDIYCLF